MSQKKFDLKLDKITMLIAAGVFASVSCAKPAKEDAASTDSPTAPARYLYVAAGACYSGAGNTTFTNTTSSNLVYRINLATGLKEIEIADYNSTPSQSGDTPVSVESIDSKNIYVLVENATAGARRIEKIPKISDGGRALFSNNTTALSVALRGLNLLSNGDLLVTKSTAIEKISSSNVRITKGANPYVNAPAGSCATSTTFLSKTAILSNQFIVFLHAAAGQNRVGFVKPEGYTVVSDCSAAVAAPDVLASPVATAYDAVNSKLIVAYAGSTTNVNINSIWVYSLTETASSVIVAASNKIYDANLYPTTYPYLLYGVSEIVLDPFENTLYVATANNNSTTITNYAIEKFKYAPAQIGVSNVDVLKRVGTTPFYDYGSDTKCISDMTIAD